MQIIEQADKWEKLRSAPELTDKNFKSYHNAAEKLSRLVRKWRRL